MEIQVEYEEEIIKFIGDKYVLLFIDDDGYPVIQIDVLNKIKDFVKEKGSFVTDDSIYNMRVDDLLDYLNRHEYKYYYLSNYVMFPENTEVLIIERGEYNDIVVSEKGILNLLGEYQKRTLLIH